MSSSSPADLAIAFRSLPRRLREARGHAHDELVAAPTRELNDVIAAAGRLLGCVGEPDSVADAIDSRHPEDWDERLLDELRRIALDAGRLLRHIAALADSD